MNSLLVAISITAVLVIADAYGSLRYRRATGDRLTLRKALAGSQDPKAVTPILRPGVVILCRYASYLGLAVVLIKMARL
ncbi:hypothetical protein FDP25_14980 [Roseovarius sp. A21]|uniref:Uncharacterized protein n=1 Tax=Roseovarius bejariae TaxID=2576383 RepID=A0A844D4G7_9RHOB|nr:hypothetical protein [Roseovarius bejariae]MRU16743.1 hypothetical protein [Roseovarius bejariae]